MTIPTLLHRIAIAIIIIIWTWLLLKPNPVPQFMAESLLGDVKFVLGKMLHFFAFAFLAWYGTYRAARTKWKWIWLALFVYAVLTELGQYYGDLWYQTHRKGSVYDVLIDSAGILLGAYVRRRFLPPSLALQALVYPPFAERGSLRVMGIILTICTLFIASGSIV